MFSATVQVVEEFFAWVIDRSDPAWSDPHGNQLLIFSHARVWTLLRTVRVFASFSPPIVKLRPCFVRFEPSNVYGAGPSDTAKNY
jgi:hypothetical protein